MSKQERPAISEIRKPPNLVIIGQSSSSVAQAAGGLQAATSSTMLPIQFCLQLRFDLAGPSVTFRRVSGTRRKGAFRLLCGKRERLQDAKINTRDSQSVNPSVSE